jgi:hypothetical protein
MSVPGPKPPKYPVKMRPSNSRIGVDVVEKGGLKDSSGLSASRWRGDNGHRQRKQFEVATGWERTHFGGSIVEKISIAGGGEGKSGNETYLRRRRQADRC